MTMASYSYVNKVILAPMVRISTLPMRLLALDHGADLVYSEEIIDHKILQCRRIQNDILGTVDFVWNDGTVVFQTCPREKHRVIFQMGTSDADRALLAAKMVVDDVAGIDINMGCPKEFSIKGGMGAALLSEPTKAVQILTTLVQGISKPVMCKIRLLPTAEETLNFVRLVEDCGIKAIAVHGRTRVERPRHDNHNDIIRQIVKAVSIPVIANGGSGEIRCFEDIAKFKSVTCASSVMIARAAQWNPSIFNKDGLQPLDSVIHQYLKYAVDYESPVTVTKYTIQQMLHEQLETERGKGVLTAGNMEQLCWRLDLGDYYEKTTASHKDIRQSLDGRTSELSIVTLLDDGSKVTEMPLRYNRKKVVSNKSPKFLLHQWAVKNTIVPPKYDTTQDLVSKTFKSTVLFDGKKYSSSVWDRCKKYAEQAAAEVCITVLQLGILDTIEVIPCKEANSRSTAEPSSDCVSLTEPELSADVINQQPDALSRTKCNHIEETSSCRSLETNQRATIPQNTNADTLSGTGMKNAVHNFSENDADLLSINESNHNQYSDIPSQKKQRVDIPISMKSM